MINYKFQKQIMLIAWALVPLVFFALAIIFVKWYAENIEPTFDDYPYSEKVDWGKVISNSPDVNFEITDSIKYYRYDERERLKRNYIRVANVTSLFPDFNATILMLEKQHPLFDKGGANQIFEIRQNNGGIYYGYIRYNEGYQFFLDIARDSVSSNKPSILPLGKFTGKINKAEHHGINIAETILNIIPVISLVVALIGLAFVLCTPNHKDKPKFLFYAVFLSSMIPAISVVGWLFDWWHFFGSNYNFPEWIALFWALSEIGLLGGLLYNSLPGSSRSA